MLSLLSLLLFSYTSVTSEACTVQLYWISATFKTQYTGKSSYDII